MTHLNPDELVDAMEGVVASAHQSHLQTCDECRRQLQELSAVFNDARQAGVPEPSPLFWNHFSARVNDAIDAEPVAAWAWWWRWQVLLPLGAAAVIMLALMIAVPRQAAPVETAAVEATDVLDPSGEADNWVMVATLVGDIDLDTAAEAGVIGIGVSDRAVLTLTAEEQQELTRLLKAELMKAKS